MIMRVLRKADRESIPFREDRVLSEYCSDNEGTFIFVRAALVHYWAKLALVLHQYWLYTLFDQLFLCGQLIFREH